MDRSQRNARSRTGLAALLLTLGLVGAPAGAAAQAPGLGLTLTPSHTLIAPGGTLRVSIGAVHQGPPVAMDVYFVVLLPDGDSLAAVGSGGLALGRLSQLAALPPFAAGVTLPTGFAQTLDNALTYTFTGSEPPGAYQFFLAALRPGALADGRVDPGDLLALATAQVTFRVARVEVVPDSVLLTFVGERRRLDAQAVDASGTPVALPITWSSSRGETVAVDPDGTLTAQALGSAQIVAEAAGVRSAPVLAVVATPAPGAILLTDAQIVGEPFETDPNAEPSFDNTYKVVLSGISAPAIDSVLINIGSKAVAGRVVAVDTTGGQLTVTLGLVSARELFPDLNLNEVFDLSRAHVTIPPDIAAAYDVQRSGDTFTFTPRPAAPAGPAEREALTALAPTGTQALGPFTCVPTLTGVGPNAPLPIAIGVPPLFSLTLSPTLDLVYTPAAGLERFVIKAEPTIKIDGGVTVTAAFEGKIECTVELFVIRIPVGGALSFVVGGLVPIGVGLEVGGKVTVATLDLGTAVVAKAKAEAGIACPGGANCEFVRSLGDFSLELTPRVEAPSLGNLRVEPSLSAFGSLEADIGNPFLSSLRFDAFQVKAGGKLEGSFALQLSQIVDTSYKSDYKASLEASAGVGANLGDALRLLGLSSIAALELTISTDLATSPSGAVTADRPTFVTGDTVNFSVKLNPASVNFFPGVYNVDRILLVRNSGGSRTEVGRLTATAGQTDFNFAFTSSGPGSAGEFFAFVVTKLLPLDLLQLEVGNAVSMSGVQISAGEAHTCAVLPDGTARCWGANPDGRLGDGTTTSASTPRPVSGLGSAVAISAGNNHTCALLADGTARCWGQNNVGQLGTGTTTSSSVPVTVVGIP